MLTDKCDMNLSDFLSQVKRLLTNSCHNFARDIHEEHQRPCPVCVLALYLMAIENLVDGNKESYDIEIIKTYCRDTYKPIDAYNIQLTPENSSQMGKDLWALALLQKVEECSSRNDYESGLSKCIRRLEENESYVLGLLLWLFPQFATIDRIQLVENMTMGNRAWMWQDKMLFWIACIRDSNYDKGKARNIETQICNLQLDSGAFSTVEDKARKGNLSSSAIGLMALVSCVKYNGSKCIADDAVLKTVRWIVTNLNASQDIDETSRAWALYSLSEFINLSK